MKTNIEEVNYNNPKEIQNGSGWWTWNKYCDRCGKLIFNKGEVLSSKLGNNAESDFCTECLRFLIDTKFPSDKVNIAYPPGGLGYYEQVKETF